LSRDAESGLGFTLADVDRDGAIEEAVSHVYGTSRATFLRTAVFGSGALLAALASPPEGSAAAKRDTNILNFDLVFEFLQSSFYLSAVDRGAVERMQPASQLWAHTLGAHELAHVKILKTVLGKKAVAKPFFDFRGVTEKPAAFIKTAVAMEDLTVALLAGQAPRFHDRSLSAAVFSLLTVEARHAAWARHIAGFTPVATAFDPPKSLRAVGGVVKSTRFIASRPRTRGKRRPHFTG
jgi:Ferritin-like domain